MAKTPNIRARNIIGARVRQARRAHDSPLSQEDLAGKLAAVGMLVDRSAISRLEQGIRIVPDYECDHLADVLGVTTDWLMGRPTQAAPQPRRRR